MAGNISTHTVHCAEPTGDTTIDKDDVELIVILIERSRELGLGNDLFESHTINSKRRDSYYKEPIDAPFCRAGIAAAYVSNSTRSTAHRDRDAAAAPGRGLVHRGHHGATRPGMACRNCRKRPATW
jgi:hypothetical protein